jgi:hypothetical protein
MGEGSIAAAGSIRAVTGLQAAFDGKLDDSSSLTTARSREERLQQILRLRPAGAMAARHHAPPLSSPWWPLPCPPGGWRRTPR